MMLRKSSELALNQAQNKFKQKTMLLELRALALKITFLITSLLVGFTRGLFMPFIL